jgi:hypothetical protein
MSFQIAFTTDAMVFANSAKFIFDSTFEREAEGARMKAIMHLL